MTAQDVGRLFPASDLANRLWVETEKLSLRAAAPDDRGNVEAALAASAPNHFRFEGARFGAREIVQGTTRYPLGQVTLFEPGRYPVGLLIWFALFDKSERYLGFSQLYEIGSSFPQVSVVLVQGASGRGLAAHATAAMVRVAHHYQLARQFFACIDQGNDAAVKSYTRAGFHHQGTISPWIPHDRERHVILMSREVDGAPCAALGASDPILVDPFAGTRTPLSERTTPLTVT